MHHKGNNNIYNSIISASCKLTCTWYLCINVELSYYGLDRSMENNRAHGYSHFSSIEVHCSVCSLYAIPLMPAFDALLKFRNLQLHI